MSRSNRDEFLTAFGLAAVVFGCVFLLVWSFSLRSGWYQQTATDRSHSYAGQAKAEIANRCRAAPETDQAKCVSEAKQAARANQREEQDLAAQKITAWWTQVMGGAAIFGAVLSAIGVLLIFTTFRETRRTAKAAEDQFALATKATAADLRPYLFVDRLELIERRSFGTIKVDEDGESVPGFFGGKIVIYFKNFGRVPARRIRVFIKEYLGRRYEGRFWQYSFTEIAIPICAPNHERRTFGGLAIKADDRLAFDMGSISKIIRLRFTFEDDTGQPFTEKASYALYGSDLETFYLLTDTRVAELRKGYEEPEFDYDDPDYN